MAYILDAECEKAGIDPKAVAKLARRIEAACQDANKLGVRLFCGSHNTLRADDGHEQLLILAHLRIQNADGGDGGSSVAADGYTRGE